MTSLWLCTDLFALVTKDVKTSCIVAYTDMNAILSTGNDDFPIVELVANLADPATTGSAHVAVKIGSTSLIPSKPATTTPLSLLHSVHLPRASPVSVHDSGVSSCQSDIVRTQRGHRVSNDDSGHVA